MAQASDEFSPGHVNRRSKAIGPVRRFTGVAERLVSANRLESAGVVFARLQTDERRHSVIDRLFDRRRRQGGLLAAVFRDDGLAVRCIPLGGQPLPVAGFPVGKAPCAATKAWF